jgi:putative nucleotide binding protein
MLQRRRPKERFVYVLDYLREGNPLDRHRGHKNRPLAQVIGEDYFILMEALVSDQDFQIEEKVDLFNSSTLRIDVVIGYEDLTGVAKDTLPRVVKKIVSNKEKFFVEFFNKSDALTIKLHALELLPGIGKKTLRIILEERKKKPFESFSDIEQRTGIKSVIDVIVERILAEIERKDKYYLFVYPTETEHRKPQEQVIYVGYLDKLKGND